MTRPPEHLIGKFILNEPPSPPEVKFEYSKLYSFAEALDALRLGYQIRQENHYSTYNAATTLAELYYVDITRKNWVIIDVGPKPPQPLKHCMEFESLSAALAHLDIRFDRWILKRYTNSPNDGMYEWDVLYEAGIAKKDTGWINGYGSTLLESINDALRGVDGQ